MVASRGNGSMVAIVGSRPTGAWAFDSDTFPAVGRRKRPDRPRCHLPTASSSRLVDIVR